jgi:hypothetical protein
MNLDGHDVSIRGRLIRIAGLAAEGYDFLDDPDEVLGRLRAQGRRIDVFTFTQELPDTAPRYGYPGEWDNVAAVPISTFEHWRTRQVKDKTRNMLRRADKAGLVVREVPFDDALVQGIAAIYNESPTRQGRRFKHYGKSLELVRRDNATFLDRSVFLGAFAGDALVGFTKIVKARRQAGLMQILAMIAYGGKQADPLSDFKRHNGFERLEIPRYYVPLTPVGRAALRLGLHHELRAYVPEALIDRFRTLRARWWARRAPVAKATS